jgi:hypothetical protein
MRSTLALVALLAGCSPEDGPLMAPGQDCLECHSGGGEARRWTAAGTWTRGARVSVTDANGKTVPLRGNQVGNFYTAESLTPPLTVSVDGVTMAATALKSGLGLQYGGCNICHGRGVAKPDLELMAPGQDCLRCHVAGGMAAGAAYTVAGTWPGAQGDVVVVDQDDKQVAMTPNAAGNFHTSEPLRFPLKTVSVGGSSMSDQMPLGYGGCNRCHGSGEAEGGDD